MSGAVRKIEGKPKAGSSERDLLKIPHALPASEVCAALGVEAARGLSNEEVAARLDRDGPNTLQHWHKTPWWKTLLAQFKSIIVWLLLVATIVAFFTQNEAEAAAILVVIILNALIGFAIEWKAGKSLEALKRETHNTARVRRGSRELMIDSSELVMGDVIILSAGDRVPADARLIEAVNLRTDESTLTGESEPIDKSVSAVEEGLPIAERISVVYLGTTAVSGRALAVVTSTGLQTELGRIGKLLSETKDEETPLERRLAGLGRRLVYIVLGIAFVVMLAGYLRGDNWWLMIEVSISLAVAAVPEGLPAVTTLILALGVLRMARRSAIVRRLAAVETLGSTTVICTDKTGTLTENRMTVREYYLANGRHINVSEKFEPDENFSRLLRVSMLCSEAAFHPEASDEIGDPTETALLVAVHKHGLDIPQERAKFEKVHEIPFESKTKRMTTVLKSPEGDSFAVLKGAPAIVLDACSQYINEKNHAVQLDSNARKRLLKINEDMADGALRVLAFADKQNITDYLDVEGGFTFLGFVGMSDPPRSGVAKAIQEAKGAGIRIVMLTGDQISTARAVARHLNISSDGDVFALHSQDIVGVESAQVADLARKAHVFARVSPEDKLLIVKALQDTGEIVAVTGDGVNDAPALKQADIGVAMGERGTEVAKEASDIVLTDDNFATIVKAIEGGRTIYANIIKFVHLLFSENLSEVLVIFAAIILGFPLPLMPLQILWVNLITDFSPALALAVEPPSKGIMRNPPRNPDESLLSSSFFWQIIWQGSLLAIIVLCAYAWALREYGEGAHARTVALFSLIAVQLGHLFNCRSRSRSVLTDFFSNPFIFMACAAVILLQIFAVYFAPLASIMDIARPNVSDLAIIIASIFIPIVIVEFIKFLDSSKVKY